MLTLYAEVPASLDIAVSRVRSPEEKITMVHVTCELQANLSNIAESILHNRPNIIKKSQWLTANLKTRVTIFLKFHFKINFQLVVSCLHGKE